MRKRFISIQKFITILVFINDFPFLFLQNASFLLFLNNTNKKQTHTSTYNTQQMPNPVQSWRIVKDYGLKDKTFNYYILYSSTSGTSFNITLICVFDLTDFVQILEISPQFLHDTVITLIGFFI